LVKRSKLASPKATGGAGVHFESRVAAYYLSSLLVEGAIRGLGNSVAKEVRLQRRYEGQPLDDVIVEGEHPTGLATVSLQVKRQLGFSPNDNLFKEFLGQCWETFTANGFQDERDRFGVALSVYSSRVDDHYQTVLSWARHSASAKDFFNRVQQRGLSNKASRDFVDAIKNGLREVSRSKPTNNSLWSFLKHLVILHFDFEKQEASRDYHHAIERVALALQPEHRFSLR